MHGLGMLPEIVEPGESTRAMTLERSFTSVFPVTNYVSPGQQQQQQQQQAGALRGQNAAQPATIHQTEKKEGKKKKKKAHLMCRAKCSLLVKLKLHGG